MLLSYGGRNCWSFREWVEINLRVRDDKVTKTVFSQKPVLPVMCFEGPNASGKSCALRVLSFIYDFCLNSFQYPPDMPIMYDTFFHNDESSEFYISFCLDKDFDTEYTYEVEMDKSKIYTERLTSKAGKTRKTLLTRRENKIITNNLYHKQNSIIYKSTASFISTLLQYGLKEIQPFADFFRRVNFNVSYGRTVDDPMTDYAAEYYYKNPEMHKRVVEQLRMWDTGIKDVEIQQVTDNQGRNFYASIFHSDVSSEHDKLIFASQSNGTKLLYNRLRDFFMTLEKGGVLIFDELDTHLHFEIIPFLLNYFTDLNINVNNAQLLFSSNSPSLLDMLEKYNVYLFKKIKGESICYRMDELRVKELLLPGVSLERLYKSGVLGGVIDVEQA